MPERATSPERHSHTNRHRLTLRHTLVATLFACVCLVAAIQQCRARGFTDVSYERHGDWYLGFALDVAQGNGYRDCTPTSDSYLCDPQTIGSPSAYRLPGYPVYLAANFLIFGLNQAIAPARLLQSVLIAMIAYLSVMLAAHYAGILGAVFVGVALLIDVALYQMAAILYTEILFTLLVLIFIVLLTKVTSARGYLAAGVVLGAALLTRGVLIFLLPLLLFVIPLRRLPMFAVGLALLIVPWTVRNLAVLHTFMPFSSGSGQVIWGANNPVVYGIEPPPNGAPAASWQAGVPTGGWMIESNLPRYRELYGASELQRDQRMQRFALDFLATVPPDLLLRAILAKLLNLFGLAGSLTAVPALVQITGAVGAALLLVSLFEREFRASLRRCLTSRAFRISLIVFAAFLVNSAVFYGSERFRLPLDPILALWSGVGVALIVQRVRAPQPESRAGFAESP